MEKITEIFDKIDLTKAVPEMDSLLALAQKVASLSILIGPVVMLLLGLMYLFLPPKEANHSVGFRTYFGMGSVEAWHFTQKIAGIAWGGVGLVLTVVMVIIYLGYKSKDVMQIAESAVTCLIWQVILAAVIYIGICVVAAIFFDRKGNRRSAKKQ